MSKMTGKPRLFTRPLQFGSMDSTGLVLSGGTNTNPIETAVASKNFIDFRTKTTASSGDNRGTYLRHYLSGGGGGEALRVFTTVDTNAAGTAHGAHISLSFGTSGSLTGLGVASRNTLHVPDAVMAAGGTFAPGQVEVYSDGSKSDPSAVTELSFIRVVNDGNATGKEKVDLKANLFSIVGSAIGAGKMIATETAAAVSHTIRIDVGGTPYYLMVSDTQ